MWESFFTVVQQVLILFVLVGVGALCGRLRIFTEEGIRSCTNLILSIVMPLVMFQAFLRDFDRQLLRGFGVAALAAVAVHVGSILLVHLLFRDKDEARCRVLRFGTIFSNAGYMSIPLQAALLGDIGVFYGTAYLAVFNLILWSYGEVCMSGDKRNASPKKLLLHPGMIAIALGLVVFVFSIPLPEVITAPVKYIAALNTPLPMMLIGYYLGQSHPLDALRDKRNYAAVFVRLLLFPLLALGGMLLCGLRGPLLMACVIPCCAPVAAATTMFSAKYGQDTSLSVNLVSLSTLFSMVTMPLILTLAQMLT